MPTLTLNELDTLKEVFRTSLDNELAKLTNSQRIEVDKFIIEIYHTMKLHTLFTPQGLSNITERVFSNTDIRDFILCLTDRFGFFSACQDLANKIEFNIIDGLNYYNISINGKLPEEYNLIPERVKNSLERDEDVILNTLSANRWITTIILMYMFLDVESQSGTVSQSTTQQPGQ